MIFCGEQTGSDNPEMEGEFGDMGLVDDTSSDDRAIWQESPARVDEVMTHQSTAQYFKCGEDAPSDVELSVLPRESPDPLQTEGSDPWKAWIGDSAAPSSINPKAKAAAKLAP